MRYVATLLCLLLASIAAPAFAHEMTNDCAAQGAKIAETAKRDAFIASCLKKVHDTKSDEQELHDKKQHCDTNVMNMKLEGKKKTEYLNHCYKENDFDKGNPDPRDKK